MDDLPRMFTNVDQTFDSLGKEFEGSLWFFLPHGRNKKEDSLKCKAMKEQNA